MTDNEINAAIAEACGVETISDGWFPSYSDPDNRDFEKPAEPFPIPNYCNDLNAMHEAEKKLPTPHHCHVFDMELSKLLGVAAGKGIGGVCEWTWHSTARQRAEAFLRTIGKQKEWNNDKTEWPDNAVR